MSALLEDVDLWFTTQGSWPDSWINSLWQACWQGGLFLLAVWLICRARPLLPVSVRHWLWWLACLKLLVTLICFTPAMFPVRYFRPLALLAFFWAVWLVGAIWNLWRTTRQVVDLRRIVRLANPVTDPEFIEELDRAASDMRLSRSPRAMQSAAIKSPLVMGVLQPTLLLPTAMLTEFSREEWRMILAHEIAHLRRRDLWLSMIPTLAQALFFFFPLVWRACREWITAREALCDADAMRATGATPAAYSAMLIKVAARGNERKTLASLSMMSGYQSLASRIGLMALLPAAVPNRRAQSSRIAFIATSALMIFPWHMAWFGEQKRASTPDELSRTFNAKLASMIVQSSPTAAYTIISLDDIYRRGALKEGELDGVLGIDKAGRILAFGRRKRLDGFGRTRDVFLLDGKGGLEQRGAVLFDHPESAITPSFQTEWNRPATKKRLTALDPSWDWQFYSRNARGEIVGAACRNAASWAFVYRSNRVFDLNTLIPAGSRWKLEYAAGINDSGQIVGQGKNEFTGGRFFLLTPNRN